MSQLESFFSKMDAACGEALDAGVFYNRDFDKFVLDRIAKDDPAVELLVGEFEQTSAGGDEWRVFWKDVDARVSTAPRGAFAIIACPEQNGRPKTFKMRISDGTGQSVDPLHALFLTKPEWRDAYEQMVGYEIYLMRNKVVQPRRLKEKNVSVAQSGCFSVGQVFKSIEIDGKKYSKAEVTAVREDGQIDLMLTKHGQRQRWKTALGSDALARKFEIGPYAPDQAPMRAI